MFLIWVGMFLSDWIHSHSDDPACLPSTDLTLWLRMNIITRGPGTVQVPGYCRGRIQQSHGEDQQVLMLSSFKDIIDTSTASNMCHWHQCTEMGVRWIQF